MALNIVNAGNEDFYQQGLAVHRAGRLAEARTCYLRALKTAPANSAVLYSLAVLCIQAGNPDEAIPYLQQAIALHPTNAAAYNALGEAHRARRDGDAALAAYAKAIEIDPQLFSAHNNRGIIEAISGRMANAIAAWKSAIDCLAGKPGTERDLSLTCNNIGNAMLEQGDAAGALEHHRRAHELDPANPIFHSNLLRDQSNIQDLSPVQLLGDHRDFWSQHAANIRPLPPAPPRDLSQALRIGLVSADFREHSVAYFLTALLDRYDRTQFSFFAYSNVTSPDTFTQWIADHTTFRTITGIADDLAAALIRNDQIDILIDLAGHTGGNRLLLFAHQPAPVQVAYLGYPVTTGATAIVWRITDNDADPEGMTDSHFSERLLRLPRPAWCYRPPPQARDVPVYDQPPCLRSGTPFTFGCFNNYAKVTAAMIETWSEILRTAPASRLFLKASALVDDAVIQAIQTRFACHGITPDRLLFAGRQRTTAEHLARYHDIDLALDTFPYHGTTTTCEALWMNVPVLTLAGTTHVSRVGVSLLKAVGLDSLITQSREQYIARATEIALHPESLIPLRANLRTRLRNSPLMNEQDFTQHFCAALQNLIRPI